MQSLTVHFLFISMLTAAALAETDTSSSSSQASSLDYAYTNYALRYLGLGDNSKLPSAASSTNDPVTQTAPDQQGYVKYITYTSDGSNVYQVTVRVKPGTYPVIWSTPVQSESSSTDGKPDDGKSASDLQPMPTKIEGHPSEDALPMTLPHHSEGHVPEVTTCHNDNGNEGTERPATSDPQNENTDGDDSKKGDSINAIPVESSLHKDHATFQGVRTLSRFFPGLYGAMSFYPVAYNPYTGQRQYIAQPVGPLTNAILPSASPTVVTKGEKATTLNPKSMASTIGPSAIPMGITTAGVPVRVQPIPYMYPYMSYQSKNSGVIYQLPAQPISANSPQVIRWVQAQPAARFQAPYASPQGYMSYQPAVLSLQSAMPLPSQNSPNMLQAKDTPETAGLQ